MILDELCLYEQMQLPKEPLPSFNLNITYIN